MAIGIIYLTYNTFNETSTKFLLISILLFYFTLHFRFTLLFRNFLKKILNILFFIFLAVCISFLYTDKFQQWFFSKLALDTLKTFTLGGVFSFGIVLLFIEYFSKKKRTLLYTPTSYKSFNGRGVEVGKMLSFGVPGYGKIFTDNFDNNIILDPSMLSKIKITLFIIINNTLRTFGIYSLYNRYIPKFFRLKKTNIFTDTADIDKYTFLEIF